ncbi:MAG TPA: hypothetical protein VHY57_07485 [Rhizomicrobium sp.]|nr:hypothetical protein [Rhizomicrobium sp.]
MIRHLADIALECVQIHDQRRGLQVCRIALKKGLPIDHDPGPARYLSLFNSLIERMAKVPADKMKAACGARGFPSVLYIWVPRSADIGDPAVGDLETSQLHAGRLEVWRQLLGLAIVMIGRHQIAGRFLGFSTIEIADMQIGRCKINGTREIGARIVITGGAHRREATTYIRRRQVWITGQRRVEIGNGGIIIMRHYLERAPIDERTGTGLLGEITGQRRVASGNAEAHTALRQGLSRLGGAETIFPDWLARLHDGLSKRRRSSKQSDRGGDKIQFHVSLS